MDPDQIASAIEYNQRQPFTIEEVKRIQALVGTEPDGLWGPNTVTAVYRWQEREGIPPDGKIWKDDAGNTWPRLRSSMPIAEGEPLRVGLWIDDAPSQVLDDAYVERVVELGVHTVAMMVNRANTQPGDPEWQLLWQPSQLMEASHRFREAGVDIVLTTWPRPKKAQIDKLIDAMCPLLGDTSISGFEVDAEGNWTDYFLDGFDSLHDAGTYLANSMRRAAPSGTRLELTTYPYHAEFSAKATLSPHMDVLLPQAYSVYRKGGAGWNARLGPGGMQNTALQLARRIPGPRLACGLAAYGQEYPGHTAHEAMDVALQTVRRQHVAEVRYWSSKWVLGHRANLYAADFLRAIAKRQDTALVA